MVAAALMYRMAAVARLWCLAAWATTTANLSAGGFPSECFVRPRQGDQIPILIS